MIRELMDSLPLWNILVFTLLVVLVAIEAGYHLGRWRTRHRKFESEAQLSSMTGAHLALLAFIMAFSFSQAAGHFADRKQLILEEANAIGTAHMRAGLVQREEAPAIARLLAEYATLRTEIAGLTLADAPRMIARSEALHTDIWAQVAAMAAHGDANVLDSLLIQSINHLFDVHEQRVAAGMRNRIPASLWSVLFILLTLSMTGIGYFSGMKGTRNPVASSGLALSFSLVLFLIADLDRPTSGLVKSDHAVMQDLQNRLRAAP